MSIEAILGFRANCKIDQCTNFLPHRERKWQKSKHRQRNVNKNQWLPKIYSDTPEDITCKSRLSQFWKNFQRAVRNGYVRERRVQTGIGEVEVWVPKVRDHSGWVRVVRSIYTLPHGK